MAKSTCPNCGYTCEADLPYDRRIYKVHGCPECGKDITWIITGEDE